MHEFSPITAAERADMRSWHQPIQGPFEVVITIDRFRELRSLADRVQRAEKDRDQLKAAHDADYAKQQEIINELNREMKMRCDQRDHHIQLREKRGKELEASLTELQNFTGYRKKSDGTWDAFDSGGQMQYSLAKEKMRVKELEAELAKLKAVKSYDSLGIDFHATAKAILDEEAERQRKLMGKDERPTREELYDAMYRSAPPRMGESEHRCDIIAALKRCGMVRP